MSDAPIQSTQAWIKVVVWLAPSAVVYISLFEIPYLGDFWPPLCILIDLFLVLVMGHLNSTWTASVAMEPENAVNRMIVFFIIQLFLIPIILGAVLLARCAI